MINFILFCFFAGVFYLGFIAGSRYKTFANFKSGIRAHIRRIFGLI